MGKRRKIVDEDDRPGALNMAYSGASKDRPLLSAGEMADEKYPFQDEFGPGCGRLVCRRCCYEDVPRCIFKFFSFWSLLIPISITAILPPAWIAMDLCHVHEPSVLSSNST